jgi:hypothetical protein
MRLSLGCEGEGFPRESGPAPHDAVAVAVPPPSLGAQQHVSESRAPPFPSRNSAKLARRTSPPVIPASTATTATILPPRTTRSVSIGRLLLLTHHCGVHAIGRRWNAIWRSSAPTIALQEMTKSALIVQGTSWHSICAGRSIIQPAVQNIISLPLPSHPHILLTA